MTGGLEALVEVARLGSITAAARRLNYTPSTVGRHLRQLEHDVGASLVTKAWHGSTLTPAGERLVPCACALVCGASQITPGGDRTRSRDGAGCLAGDGIRCVGFGPCAGSAQVPGPTASSDGG